MTRSGPTCLALMAALAVLLALVSGSTAAGSGEDSPPHAGGAPRSLLAHYLSWYEARPASPQWGWHWTMGRFDPARTAGGRPEAASHYRPLLGLYDSGDPDLLECHALLMKLAGIDGVVLDWYGPDDYLDYGLIDRNCQRLLPYLKRAGLRFCVCYEDQTVARLVAGNRLAAAEAEAHGQRLLRALATRWFADDAYLRLGRDPLFLVFGPQYYPEGAWPRLLAALPNPSCFVTLHHRRGGARGAFDWPLPAAEQGLRAVEAFYTRAADWPVMIPTAFPRFHDVYQEAGIHPSYGRIDDRDGKTYETTLERALQSRAEVVQLATWNDWGEGTSIEPSQEFQYRDLETTQRLRRRHLQPAFAYTAADLRLPVRLFHLRKQHAGDPPVKSRLDAAAGALFAGDPDHARRLLSQLD